MPFTPPTPRPLTSPTRRRTARTTISIAAAIIALAATVGMSAAYWSMQGSGSGSSTAGSGASLAIAASFPSGIYPGGEETVTFTVDNPNDFAVHVSTIGLAGVTVDAAHAGCAVADFTMATVTIDETVAAGAVDHALTAVGTLRFANTAANQDACKGAVITLALTSA